MDLFLCKNDYEIRDKKGSKNLVTDHLSRIIYGREFESSIFECLAAEKLYAGHPNP